MRLPIGSERIQRDTVYIKTNNSTWRMKHHLIWEAAHGPLPEGDIIYFIDGDKHNLSLNNLASMSLGAERFHKIGAERLRCNYVTIKINRLHWRWKHHLIWEAAHGPISEEEIIYFIDGDRRNCSLNNLASMPRSDFRKKCSLEKVPLGSIQLDTKKNQMVKVAEKKWKLKHHLIWESANGPIPKGYRLFFIDGNQLNFSLNNLLLISDKECVQLALNGLFSTKIDPQLFRAAVNMTRLNLALERRLRDLKKPKS